VPQRMKREVVPQEGRSNCAKMADTNSNSIVIAAKSKMPLIQALHMA
jgi:hypothetical protein